MPNLDLQLKDLDVFHGFIRRHIGPDPTEEQAMLAELGMDDIEQLLDRVVPESIRRRKPLAVKSSLSERQVLLRLYEVSIRNQLYKSFIGMGYYNTQTPTVIERNLLRNPAWYTSYTPYQAEISQGRLEALLNFQTMVSDLTGMELANASVLDEATAAAEAMAMCHRLSKSKSDVFYIANSCHPQTIEVVTNRAKHMHIKCVIGDPFAAADNPELFGVLLQYPCSTGEVHDYRELVAGIHAKKGLVAVAADLLSLTLLTPPGEFDADIVVGSSQRFGVPLGYGGPHAGFMATRDAYKRSLPGRLIGVSKDTCGEAALRLTLQTREQHIRREKATSNICTAQALLAIMASMYAVYHGPAEIKRIAQRVHRLTVLLAEGLSALGMEVNTKHYFDTITVNTGNATEFIMAAARSKKMNLRQVDAHTVGISLDEVSTRGDVTRLYDVFTHDHGRDVSIDELDAKIKTALPQDLIRSSAYLTHPVFNSHHSETDLMRYMRKLADKDLALDRSMIPLGSCTMKLNSATQLIPVTWPGFGRIHPFVPLDQAQGYQQLIVELEQMLCACTGYDAISLQPNSGAQGEYAGLLAIKSYHESRDEGHRDICVVPSSAHGTNPASAQMAGMKVAVVGSAKNGNIDLDDLRAKCEKHSTNLAAIMITYPSTHGVFEDDVREVCDIVHQHGGQVYIDGANMNAMVGVCAPGKFGGDVSHLNLHKTFAIPHGGGGPGVGPIGVKEHLKPFLPSTSQKSNGGINKVAAAPFGSAGILPISWAYISLLGRDGLPQATAIAILNANYIAHRLKDHFPILYTGSNGLVAHECIIDTRVVKEFASVDDIAKRLIDYGFHAPTMSFPVAGTLMIEPTESESKEELDRFCEAMISIRGEIRDIEEGRMDPADNPLTNAPHTVDMVCADEWTHAYSRQQAAYPLASLRDNKYWSPVGRVDNVFGDTHVVCSCPPLSAYAEEES
ncbi:MAG: Glycine dehydrogenase [decarboxylating] (glycine cleavage system P protein) (EC 1.4.4.2) [Olavius algarvensis Gamma 3 endosymbiont]|nr:MAG: Glycine dehydrogenase [decarboxylating] (glycine cleavage system P protein) (EC 1.4.4.2) [Olavius algarvensis Gamma 3 endosymbiont]